MIPVVTPDEMRAIDAAAPEPVEELIARAGAAVARAAIDMLGGGYGRRVNVIAGSGNNGADGRDAARRLRARGATVEEFDPTACPEELPPADLVIDAAFGTGFRPDPSRPWNAPGTRGAPVLAVDVPSGIDALTGTAGARVLDAQRTITFQALKPGLVFADGAARAGEIDVVDIGLDASSAACHLVERRDVAEWWPVREVDAHKWRSAVKVVAGSPGMPGAAELCTAAAARAGSGLVTLAAPGCRPHTRSEIIQQEIPLGEFRDDVLSTIDRFGALVVGPGLGRRDETLQAARACIEDAPVPVVVDGDGLFAVASSGGDGAAPLLRSRGSPTVLTPHDGEFEVLTGARPAADRIAAARDLARSFDSTVLLKGPTTVIASPDDDTAGTVLLVDVGDQRLATAGTGDVLAGLVGALLAAGLVPQRAAASAAWLHGVAAGLGPRQGMLAGDIIELLPQAIGSLG